MNKVIFTGNLGQAPEIRNSQSGTTVVTFSLAVKRRFHKDNEPDTDWFQCIAFGKTAEFVEKYLSKGSKVVVEGEVQNNNYEDKTGVKHYGTKIIVNSVEFGESKGAAQQITPAAEAKDDSFVNVPDGIPEELPFN